MVLGVASLGYSSNANAFNIKMQGFQCSGTSEDNEKFAIFGSYEINTMEMVDGPIAFVQDKTDPIENWTHNSSHRVIGANRETMALSAKNKYAEVKIFHPQESKHMTIIQIEFSSGYVMYDAAGSCVFF